MNMEEAHNASVNSESLVQVKSPSTCLLLKNSGNDLFKEKKFEMSSQMYTMSMLYAPPYCKHEDATTSFGELEDYALGVLYGNRSAVFFRLKQYENCIKDIYRAMANGPHDTQRYTKLMTRLAWSYWHIKNVHECKTTVKILLDQSDGMKSTREVKVLQHLIHKARLSPKHEPKLNGLQNNENDVNTNVLQNIDINFEKTKGRFITAKGYMTSAQAVIHEKAFCVVLNPQFIKTHCSQCIKECRGTGIPCHGCTYAMYCNENCRQRAWEKYHWLECSMWPAIHKIETFAHMALRLILVGAHEIYLANLDEEKELISGHTCNSIAIQLKNTCVPSKSNASSKHKKKQVISTPSTIMGLNPGDNKYYGKYWSVFNLQTHYHDHPKAIVAKCEELAYFLATLVEKCLMEDTSVCNTPKHAINIETILNKVFSSLAFPALHDGPDESFLIEKFRERVNKVSEELSKQVPNKKSKKTHTFPRDLPKNSHDVLAYLIRHHMLQLYTNSQAVIQVTPDENSNTGVETVSQKRLAVGIFPHCSLFNHSCDANTFIHFVGDCLTIKMVRTVKKGEEITHSYGPCVTRYSYKDRQRILKEQYFFKCECELCLKHKTASADEQASMDQLTAYRCNSCSGPVKIIECTRDTKSTWGKCIDESCLKLHNLTEVQNLYLDIMQEVNLQSFKIMKGDVSEAIEVLIRALKTLETILYRNHQTIGALHDQIAFCYSRKSDTSLAIEHIIKSARIISLKFGAKSVEYGREVYKLCTLYFKTTQYYLAHKYLAIASPILLRLLPSGCEERRQVEQMVQYLESMDLQLKLTN